MALNAQQPLRVKLKFLADRSLPLAYVASKGGGDKTEHQGNFHAREVKVHDARRVLPGSNLDREGFVLRAQESTVKDFYDERELRQIYHPELIALILGETGARRVEVFDDTHRSASIAQQKARGIREPANIVHNDYTAKSGVRRLVEHFSARVKDARRLQQRRFAIINAWRTSSGPVVDQPLVLCDASTVSDGDLVSVERRAEDRIGELQVMRYDPGQRWFYYPRMDRDEVLLFKTFDSVIDGRARFTPHSSFRHPEAGDDTPPRESIESRCFVFY